MLHAPVVKCTNPVIYIIVVVDNENLLYGVGDPEVRAVPSAAVTLWNSIFTGVALTELVQHDENLQVPVNIALRFPHTSQSPAVKLIEVKSVAVWSGIFIELPVAIMLFINSPTNPDPALLLVAVPTMPFVVGLNATLPNVTLLVVAIFCGVLRVTFPTPGVTIIWFAVPIILPETTPPISVESWVTVSLYVTPA